jgi:hypothetical protein
MGTTSAGNVTADYALSPSTAPGAERSFAHLPPKVLVGDAEVHGGRGDLSVTGGALRNVDTTAIVEHDRDE